MAKKKAPAKKAGPKLVKNAKSAKKAKGAKPGRVWQSSNRGADRAAAAKRAHKTPEQVPLIKGLRRPGLDRACRRIGDNRAAVARMQAEGRDLESHAHDEMRKDKVNTWQSAGVTLVRIQGEERLRVSTSRQTASTAPGKGAGDDIEPVEELEEQQADNAVDDVDAAAGDVDEDQVH